MDFCLPYFLVSVCCVSVWVIIYKMRVGETRICWNKIKKINEMLQHQACFIHILDVDK